MRLRVVADRTSSLASRNRSPGDGAAAPMGGAERPGPARPPEGQGGSQGTGRASRPSPDDVGRPRRQLAHLLRVVAELRRVADELHLLEERADRASRRRSARRPPSTDPKSLVERLLDRAPPPPPCSCPSLPTRLELAQGARARCGGRRTALRARAGPRQPRAAPQSRGVQEQHERQATSATAAARRSNRRATRQVEVAAQRQGRSGAAKPPAPGGGAAGAGGRRARLDPQRQAAPSRRLGARARPRDRSRRRPATGPRASPLVSGTTTNSQVRDPVIPAALALAGRSSPGAGRPSPRALSPRGRGRSTSGCPLPSTLKRRVAASPRATVGRSRLAVAWKRPTAPREAGLVGHGVDGDGDRLRRALARTPPASKKPWRGEPDPEGGRREW